jgi:hypothetical protein
MFQLETEVRRWCKRAIPVYWLRSSCLAELEDHLLCIVEELKREGTSEEQAFFIATERLGNARILKDEFRKNARYSSNRSAREFSKWVAIGGGVIVVAATLRSVSATELTNNLLATLYAFPSSFLNFFSFCVRNICW